MSYTDHSNYLKDSMKTDGELHMKMKARTSCKYRTWTEKKQRSSSFTSCPKEGSNVFFAAEKYSVLFLQDYHLLLSWMSLYLHSNYIEIYFIFTFLECICQLGDRRDIALQLLMIFETLWCCGLFNNVWYMFPITLNCWKLLC